MNAELTADQSTPSIVQRLLHSAAVRCYAAGIALIVFTLITTDALNPRGIRGGSWFDSLTMPLSCLSLLLCTVAPFLSGRPLAQRFGFLALAIFGFIAACVASLTVS